MKRIDYRKIKLDGFTVQGYTIIENKYAVISAYKLNCNSRLYIYNAKKGDYEYTIILDNRAHVGGITYDSLKKILFVTGSKGMVNCYDFNKIKDKMKNKLPLLNMKDIKIDNDISISKYTKKNMATIFYYNNCLYASSFGFVSCLYKIEYSVNYDRSFVSFNSISKVKSLGASVQGIALFNEDNINYLFVSRSIGSLHSRISIYKQYKSRFKYLNTNLVKHFGLEGIYIDKSGVLSGVYEFGKSNLYMISIDTLFDSIKKVYILNYLLYKICSLFYEIKRLCKKHKR